MKTLLLWGGGPPALARRRADEGARLLAWTESAAASLEAAGVPAPFWRAGLPAGAAVGADEAALAWTKQWGRRPLVDGRSFREIATWKESSLWWPAEIFLHYSTASPGFVRLIEALHRLLGIETPDEVEVHGLPAEAALLVGRTCRARGVLFHGPRDRPPRRGVLGLSLRARWNTVKTILTALKTSLAGGPPRLAASDRHRVLFLSHAAFWRTRTDPETGEPEAFEHYYDRLLPEVADQADLEAVVLAVGPRTAFRRRRTRDRLADWLRLHPDSGRYVHVNRFTSWAVCREVWKATREIRSLWRALRRSPSLFEAFSHREVSFPDLAAPDLAGTLLLQLPWAVRCREEMAAALRAVRPAVVVLYAESSGWGRAAVTACRAEGVPTVALQHGILYPRYYSYYHDADERDWPRPDRTAVFGEAARRLLQEMGHYPPESLVVTGSPKFDELVAAATRWDREAIRTRLGVEPGGRLVVVASRYRPIRETHQAIGPAFADLVRAVESLPDVVCLVKPHPAESDGAYRQQIREAKASRVRIVRSEATLPELLHAADALVTVESLSAVEALVLGRAVVILNGPTNLQGLVEAGVALGVAAGADPTGPLRGVLSDAATRDSLARARQRYLADILRGADGGATGRIVALLRETANRHPVLG